MARGVGVVVGSVGQSLSPWPFRGYCCFVMVVGLILVLVVFGRVGSVISVIFYFFFYFFVFLCFFFVIIML